MNTICISGMGMITPLGNTVSQTWDNLTQGTSGITEIDLFETSTLRNSNGGQVHDISSKTGESRSLQMLRSAVKEALESSGLSNLTDCALVLGTNFGSTVRFSEYVKAKRNGTTDTKALAEYRFQSYVDRLKAEFCIEGPSAIISIACATGLGIIDTGIMMLKHVPYVICASVDELTLYSYAGLNALRAISKDCIRPFSKNRSGTQFGEGAGAVVLERVDTCTASNRKPLAVVNACALNNDAFHTTAPDKEGTGIAAVMESAFAQTDKQKDEIAYFSAHGTGTKYNDSIETKALAKAYGEHAEKLKINALKSMTAHAMGAAGIIELICTIQSIRTGKIPPTINFQEKDEECPLNYCHDGTVELDVKSAMSNSYGIGGANGSVIVSGADDE